MVQVDYVVGRISCVGGQMFDAVSFLLWQYVGGRGGRQAFEISLAWRLLAAYPVLHRNDVGDEVGNLIFSRQHQNELQSALSGQPGKK